LGAVFIILFILNIYNHKKCFFSTKSAY